MTRHPGLIGRRLLGVLPNLVGVVVITFILTRALPGDRCGGRPSSHSAAALKPPPWQHGLGTDAIGCDILSRTPVATRLDLGIAVSVTDRVAVMCLGKIVEMGASRHVFDHPAHPYTQALVSAIPGHGPRIGLAGEVQSPINPPPRVYRFASRCPAAQDRCVREAPALRGTTNLGAHTAACHLARWPETAAA